MTPGDSVRFRAHGLTGHTYKVVTVDDGGEVTLQDPRGRLLHKTPTELLEHVSAKAWREVDELEAG